MHKEKAVSPPLPQIHIIVRHYLLLRVDTRTNRLGIHLHARDWCDIMSGAADGHLSLNEYSDSESTVGICLAPEQARIFGKLFPYGVCL